MLRSEEGLTPPLSPSIVVEELTPQPFEEGGSAGAAESAYISLSYLLGC